MSSKSITTPEPSVAPAARVPSNESSTSSLSGPTKPPAAPPSSTAFSSLPAGHAARLLDHLAQRDPERRLVEAGALDAAREAEQPRAGRLLGADPGEGLAAAEHDVQHVDQALDVVDDGRLAEQADVHRERRLVARLAAEALDRVEQRRLLAADVGAGALAQLDVEREPGAQHVLAEQAVRVSLARSRWSAAPRPAGTRRARRCRRARSRSRSRRR